MAGLNENILSQNLQKEAETFPSGEDRTKKMF
jgi:hypothetical protein